MTCREVLRKRGESETESQVSCPRRGQVHLDVCLECEHSEGFTKTVDGRRCHLLCSLPVAADGPAPADVGADEVPIGAIMTTNVVCVRDDLSLDALARLFIERNISGAPVVSADGAALGMVSKTDLVSLAGDARNFALLTVADIMMPIAFTLGEHASLSQAAGLMAAEGIHRVPVVDEAGKILGILSSLDILRWLARRDGYLP